MTAKNFIIKNGLTIGSTEAIDSSGDLTAASFGTAANEAIDDRVNALLTAGTGVSLSYDDAAGTLTINGQVGDVTGVTAGDGLSGGGNSGAVTVALDLNELTGAVVAVGADSIPFIDATDNSTKKESIADFVSGIAGTGLTASSGQLSISETGDISSVVAGTGLTGGGTSGDVTVNVIGGDGITANANDVALSSSVAGDGLSFSSGVLAVGVDDSSIELNSDAVRVKATGITNAMLAGSIANAKLVNSAITIDGSSTALGGSITTTNTVDMGDGFKVEDGDGTEVTITENKQIKFVEGGGVDINFTDVDSGADGDEFDLTFTIPANGVTNAMLAGSIANDKLAGSIANSKLANSSITVGDGSNTTAISLGNTVTFAAGEGMDVAESSGTVTYTSELATETNAGVATFDGTDFTVSSGDVTMNAERIQDIVGAMVTSNTESAITVAYQDGDGTLDFTVSNTDSITEGSSNLYYTNARAQAAITAGTGVAVSSGAVSIGQAVATSSNVQFANLTLSGNLTVNGATSTVSSTNTTLTDNLIELNNGAGSNANDSGIVIERGSTGDNAFMGWDESADSFVLGTTTATGSSTGNLTITPVATSTGALTITNASNSGGTARNIYQSTSAPGGGDGAVGDLWILYS